MSANRKGLAARNISVVFAFGPSIGRDGGPSWASFMSPRGTGRLIRAPNGSSRVDVYAFADGACLLEERRDDTEVGQLSGITDLLASRAGRPAMTDAPVRSTAAEIPSTSACGSLARCPSAA